MGQQGLQGVIEGGFPQEAIGDIYIYIYIWICRDRCVGIRVSRLGFRDRGVIATCREVS